jgi:hypothetical protein
MVLMAEGGAADKNLQVAIDVCERTSESLLDMLGGRSEGDGNNGGRSSAYRGVHQRSGSVASTNAVDQALWNYMLDRLLEIKHGLKIGAEVGCHRTILEQVLTEMMTHAWNKMSAYVPLAHIVRRITDDHSHAHLGELRDILLRVLDTSRYDDMIYRSAIALVKADLHALMGRRRRLVGGGKRVRPRRAGAGGTGTGTGTGALDSLSALTSGPEATEAHRKKVEQAREQERQRQQRRVLQLSQQRRKRRRRQQLLADGLGALLGGGGGGGAGGFGGEISSGGGGGGDVVGAALSIHDARRGTAKAAADSWSEVKPLRVAAPASEPAPPRRPGSLAVNALHFGAFQN